MSVSQAILIHLALTAIVATIVVQVLKRRGWPSMEKLKSAGLAIVLTILVGIAVVSFATNLVASYGSGVFVVLPVVCGFLTTLLYGWRHRLSFEDGVMLGAFSITTFGVALLVVAIEGIVCLAMAAPIAYPAAMAGSMMAFWLLKLIRDSRQLGATVMLATAFPFGAIQGERLFLADPPAFPVTSTIDIAAPPAKVWSAIVNPYRIQRPGDLMFHAGIAYPLGAWIEGTGTKATRICDFSTGRYIEPIVEWSKNKLLRFKVIENPPPMQEWNPFADIHPPHLEGFLVVKQGQFRLTEIPGGTRLEGTTWYQHGLYPVTYWRWWSDAIIHRIHGAVLGRLKQVAEN